MPDRETHTIEPDGYYSEADVTLELGVGPQTQQQERQDGRLKFTNAGGVPVYRGQDLIEWLDASRSVNPGGASRSTATQAGPSASGTHSPPPHTQEQEMPRRNNPIITAFNSEVQEKMKLGMNRHEATRAVVRENPECHRRYLKAINSDRPKAIEHL